MLDCCLLDPGLHPSWLERLLVACLFNTAGGSHHCCCSMTFVCVGLWICVTASEFVAGTCASCSVVTVLQGAGSLPPHTLCAMCCCLPYVHLTLLHYQQMDEEEIKAAYRKLALKLHPDRQIGKDAVAQAQAAEQFALLLKAYDTLKDPEQRKLYNAGQYMEATLKL